MTSTPAPEPHGPTHTQTPVPPSPTNLSASPASCVKWGTASHRLRNACIAHGSRLNRQLMCIFISNK